MLIVQRVRNKLRALLQAYGTPSLKRSLWNGEFSQGRWDCLETTSGDIVYGLIEKYSRKGSILDLGCGSGSTGNELDAKAYSDYVGVDISDKAVEKAKVRTEENRRTAKNDYFQSDISSYVPARQFDVILFRDSIYYVPRSKITGMLDRYSKYLREGGVFIVRMWDATEKYKAIADAIESHFEVVEKDLSGQSSTAVIVFRERR